MKVGTDGVVLGVTSDFSGCSEHPAEPLRLVDVGTGTGLVSLMVKQRYPYACVTAVEIDPDATLQAQENFDASPWQLQAVCAPWQAFASDAASMGVKFDGIFCNPPYFTASLKNPSQKRTQARHNDSLPFAELLQGVAAVLADDGLFYVILPAQDKSVFDSLASAAGLALNAVTYVHPVEDAEPKRVVLCYKKAPATVVTEAHLYIETAVRGVYTEQFRTLIQPYYLKL